MAGEAELIKYIFEGRSSALAAPFAEWLRESRRFKAFAEEYKDKIRRKLRLVTDREGLSDLRFELEVAYRLHHEPSFTVAYEQNAGKGRSPDFQATFKTHTPFNVEATRMRLTAAPPAPDMGEVSPLVYKLIEMTCDKVGQMPPGVVNVLVTTSDQAALPDELDGAMKLLRLLAERKAEGFFVGRGFKDAADFLRQFRQLSGVVYLNPEDAGILWLNSLAKHLLSKEMAAAVGRAMRAKMHNTL